MMRLPQQMYDERLVTPMRQELTRIGLAELRTPEEVDAAVQQPGTTLVVVNSVCGCSARMARPATAIALENPIKPDHLATVFAGQDAEATTRARSYFTGYAPSSPQIALLKDGALVFMLERWQIEGRAPEEIAHDLVNAFNKYCAPAAAT
ncbi:MAG TPA: BrxA/BrxB family bacilliredoxin [Gemmatimonadaceae bacterium]|nr:BrxA/BrxB family bacilliredoxin [Gemmatimonadaceae bacterium]